MLKDVDTSPVVTAKVSAYSITLTRQSLDERSSAYLCYDRVTSVIAFQLPSYMTRHSMFEELQLAYKTHHSTEAILVKVFNDIMLRYHTRTNNEKSPNL